MFEWRMVAGWGDMDFNSHMRNTAYLGKSADLRMMYFSENGFPMQEFMSLRLGPVVMHDRLLVALRSAPRSEDFVETPSSLK
jgi:acyl-CoA thioester hydrolase